MTKGCIYVMDYVQLPSFVGSVMKTSSEFKVSNYSYIKSKLHIKKQSEWGTSIFVYSSFRSEWTAWQNPLLLSSHVIFYDTENDQVEIKKDRLQSGVNGLVTFCNGGNVDFLMSPSKALATMAKYNFQPEEPVTLETEMAVLKQGGRFSVRSLVYKL